MRVYFYTSGFFNASLLLSFFPAAFVYSGDDRPVADNRFFATTQIYGGHKRYLRAYGALSLPPKRTDQVQRRETERAQLNLLYVVC